jgi:hypothetical protein
MTARSRFARPAIALVVLIALIGLGSARVSAHCDGLDGPVVKAAQAALASGDVNLVLIWVQKGAEAEIRRAFDLARETRTLGPSAKELADTYFFETLVRVHRAGEGAPFTGLKPAGRDLGPAIPAADRALVSHDVTPLMNLLVERLRAGLSARYEEVTAAKNFNPQNVEAGREYVRKYVEFIHFVEGTFEAATRAGHGHDTEAPAHTPEHR